MGGTSYQAQREIKTPKKTRTDSECQTSLNFYDFVQEEDTLQDQKSEKIPYIFFLARIYKHFFSTYICIVRGIEQE